MTNLDRAEWEVWIVETRDWEDVDGIRMICEF